MLGRVKYDDAEIVKAVDLSDMDTLAFRNLLSLITKLLGQAQNAVIISGLEVIACDPPERKVKVSSGLAYDPVTDSFLHNTATIELVLAVPDNAFPRIDLVEVRGTVIDYEIQQRAFKNPVTGSISYQTIPTKEKFLLEARVKTGIASANPIAPIVDSGWVKLAEVLCNPGQSTVIYTSNIRNCIADLDGGVNSNWTTEQTITWRVRSIKDIRQLFFNKHTRTGQHVASWIPVVDVGGQYVAEDVENVLQELASRNRGVSLISTDTVLRTNSIYVVDAAPSNAALLLTLPITAKEGDRIILICRSTCKIVQTDDEQTISWNRMLFTTKGTAGYFLAYPGDIVVLTYKGSGVTSSPPVATPYAISAGSPIAWSPDGKYVVFDIGTTTRPFTVYQLLRGANVTNPSEYPIGSTYTLDWTTNERYLAVGADYTKYLYVYDYSTNPPTKIDDPSVLPTYRIRQVRWSPNGQYLAAVSGFGPTTYMLLIYSFENGVLTYLSDVPPTIYNKVLCIAWSPDGRYLVVGRSYPVPPLNLLSVYDWSTWPPVEVTGFTIPGILEMTGVCVSPCGRYVAYTSNQYPYIHLFAFSSGQLTQLSPPSTLPTGPGIAITWSGNGRFLAVAFNSPPYVIVYDWKTGIPVAMPALNPPITNVPYGIHISNDGRFLAVAVNDSTNSMYELINGVFTRIPFGREREYPRTVCAVRFSPSDTYLALGAFAGSVFRVLTWNMPTLCALVFSVSVDQPATSTVWRRDGRYLAASSHFTPYVAVYDFDSGTPVKLPDPTVLPTGPGMGIVWSPDGRYLAVGHQNSPYITIYDFSSGTLVKISDPTTLPTGLTRSVAWSPDGRYLCVCHNNSPYITIYDWISGAPVKIPDPATLPPSTTWYAIWSPDGRYLAISHNNAGNNGYEISIYDCISGSPTRVDVIPTTLTGIFASWSPDGRHLLTIKGTIVNVFDFSTGRREFAGTVTLYQSAVSGAWIPDGSYFMPTSYNPLVTVRTPVKKEWVLDLSPQVPTGLDFRRSLRRRFK